MPPPRPVHLRQPKLPVQVAHRASRKWRRLGSWSLCIPIFSVPGTSPPSPRAPTAATTRAASRVVNRSRHGPAGATKPATPATHGLARERAPSSNRRDPRPQVRLPQIRRLTPQATPLLRVAPLPRGKRAMPRPRHPHLSARPRAPGALRSPALRGALWLAGTALFLRRGPPRERPLPPRRCLFRPRPGVVPRTTAAPLCGWGPRMGPQPLYLASPSCCSQRVTRV